MTWASGCVNIEVNEGVIVASDVDADCPLVAFMS